MEKAIFFNNNEYKLFGVLHQPGQQKSEQQRTKYRKDLGIIICSPMAEEKLISHRVLVNLARSITSSGYYCLRFDYMGHGDSDGSFEDSSVKTRLSDITCAINYLKNSEGLTKIVLLGVRFGATLAMLVSEENIDVDSLILISPIIVGKSYIENLLRSNLTMQMATYKKITKNRSDLISELIAGKSVNIDGYLLTPRFFTEINNIDLLNENKIKPQNVLMINMYKKNKIKLNEDTKILIAKLQEKCTNVEIQNIEADYFWTEMKIYNSQIIDLQDAVINWLRYSYAV